MIFSGGIIHRGPPLPVRCLKVSTIVPKIWFHSCDSRHEHRRLLRCSVLGLATSLAWSEAGQGASAAAPNGSADWALFVPNAPGRRANSFQPRVAGWLRMDAPLA